MILEKPLKEMNLIELIRFIAQLLWRKFGPVHVVVVDAFTFDEIHLAPKYTDVSPDEEISTEVEVVKGIRIKTPFLSAAMDTVTGSKMAVTFAKNGAVSVLHRNCTIPEQVKMVKQVKRHQSTMVVDPVTLSPDTTIEEAHRAFDGLEFSKILIVDGDNKLLGLISKSRVIDFSDEPTKLVKEIMLPFEELAIAYGDTDIDTARAQFKKTGKKRLPIIVSETDRTLIGLYFKKDLDNLNNFPNMSVDTKGRLVVAAAIGVGEEGFKRAQALIAAGVDFLVIDVAQGHSKAVGDIIGRIKAEKNSVPVVGGNVVTIEGAQFLVDAGADAIKVGVGPGAICTTREKTGNGKAQWTAIVEVSQVTKKAGIPLIADGGIKFTGDVTKAIAAGADAVMMGSVFAATDETPAQSKKEEGVTYKEYRGMGSPEAMEAGLANDRYGTTSLVKRKKVAEGVSGWIISKGPVQDVIDEYLSALKQSMGTYQGARTIADLQKDPVFTRIGGAGQLESGTRGLTTFK